MGKCPLCSTNASPNLFHLSLKHRPLFNTILQILLTVQFLFSKTLNSPQSQLQLKISPLFSSFTPVFALFIQSLFPFLFIYFHRKLFHLIQCCILLVHPSFAPVGLLPATLNLLSRKTLFSFPLPEQPFPGSETQQQGSVFVLSWGS